MSATTVPHARHSPSTQRNVQFIRTAETVASVDSPNLDFDARSPLANHFCFNFTRNEETLVTVFPHFASLEEPDLTTVTVLMKTLVIETSIGACIVLSSIWHNHAEQPPDFEKDLIFFNSHWLLE
jgi:hypothetical protein